MFKLMVLKILKTVILQMIKKSRLVAT